MHINENPSTMENGLLLNTEPVHQLVAENESLKQDPAVHRYFQCLCSSVSPLEREWEEPIYQLSVQLIT